MTADWSTLRPALGALPTLAGRALHNSTGLTASIDQVGAVWRDLLDGYGVTLDDDTAHTVLATIVAYVSFMGHQARGGRMNGAYSDADLRAVEQLVSSSMALLVAAMVDLIPPPEDATRG